MHKRRLVGWLIALFLLPIVLLGAWQPLRGENGIVVSGADTTHALNISADSALAQALATLRDRVSVTQVDTLQRRSIAALPAALAAAQAAIEPRPQTNYVDSRALRSISAPPAGLLTTLAGLADRPILHVVDTAERRTLTYPSVLFNDGQGPFFLFESVNTVLDRATIRWQTDEYADSLLRYGPVSGGWEDTLSNNEYAKEHRYILTDLTDGLYRYQYRSRDRSGNATTSAWQTFRISTDVSAPLITDVVATPVGRNGALITWKTNEPATSVVAYDVISGPYFFSVSDTDMVGDHAIELTGLLANTRYYFRVESTDAAGNTTRSAEATFMSTVRYPIYLPMLRRP